ncbi:pantothenate kinase [Winogradskyella sp. PC-19]|uniref:type III pantothenate kinase n=1 Tax=unclassified Winogradskyella TaxID=2615021 RepID=UPI000B3C9A06|nr:MULTISPECIES: type III pantothenate kinase [unclassified Winogradskyella]ARV10146.1 pantothenate kinase [Winogradskyella sp. PC-19]RZN82761.1 MAG: type III pantothenate kinase [Winogradskyella sp.]
MNLIVDVGNTRVKFAVFDNNLLKWKKSFLLSDLKTEFEAVIKQFPKTKRAIVSSVGRLSKKDIAIIKKDLKLLELDSETEVPFQNNYKTPKTLGVDRIALVSGSVLKSPDQNVLIIDAGTCITYDFITDKNVYLGGAISPGLRLRYKSLNNLTANLPLLETKVPKRITGNTTESSIHSGVVLGTIYEIDGIVKAYSEKYSDLTVILTGGDAKMLSKQLKSSIFANSDFLLEGLNYILEFNS